MAERPQLSVVKIEPASPPSSSSSSSPASVTSPHMPRAPGLPLQARSSPGSGPGSGRLLDGLARVLVVVAVATVAAVGLAPRLVKGDLPIDAELLGTPARGVVKADRDYALVDGDATGALRRLGSQRSRAVWDLDDERARRDAQLLQKALLRLAVVVEAVRKQQLAPAPRDPRTRADVPASAKAAIDEVRAVIAGELASASLEAPQDAGWRALVTLVWENPAAVDVIVAVVAAELPAPIVAVALPGDSELLVRSLDDNAEERVVAAADVVSVSAARDRLQDRLQSALAELTPSSSYASALSSWLGGFVRPTLSWNAAETEARRRRAAESVPPVIVRAHRGETVLRPGEIITTRHQLLARAMAVQQAEELRLKATLGTGCFVALVVVVVYLFGARRVFQRQLRTRDVVFLGVMLALSLGLIVAADATAPLIVGTFPGLPSSMVAFVIPAAFGPMCVRLTLPPDVALLFALVVALLGGVVVEPGMSWAVVAALSSMTGVAFVMRGPRRLTIVLAGVGAGLVGVFAALTLELFRGALAGPELLWLSLATLAGGALSGLLAVVVVPVVEGAFGYVTDQRLYALSDLNHPLLKDMIVHAPGTWHHSVRVAVLAERAAVAVGANPLLARVMALYHDIGKIPQPLSFRENQQNGDNPHDRLAPEESAAILRGHVSKGLALARDHGLPRAVADVIEEHHADMVMERFLDKAHARARDAVQLRDGAGVVVDERLFRYSGRLPQTKESALVLLADQIESAARVIEPPQHLNDVVDHFVNRALTHDMLAACDLSLKELGRARAVLKDALLELSRPSEKSR